MTHTGRDGIGGNNPLRLASAVDHYLRARVDLAQATRRDTRYVLLEFAAVVGTDLAVARLLRKHVEVWMAHQIKRVAPSTLHARLGKVRTFSGWLISSGYLRANPTEGVRPPRLRQGVPRELSDDEVTKLLNTAPDPRGELILLLMVMEGLRRAEIAHIQTSDIDWLERLLLVHGKNNKEREVPISDDTWDAIHAYLGQYPVTNGPLIRSYVTDRGLMPSTIGGMVGQWFTEAGVKERPYDGKSGHALRHTCAGVMLDEGADVRDVKEALGHADLATTFGYLKRRQSTRRLREAMGKRHYR